MNPESRTSKSIKNAQVALLFYFINLILQFFSRKIFLDYLGAEILGLNTTVMNLLQFLNLAELGISAAVSYSLYLPLADKNHQEINEIVSVQGFLYRRIGFIILSASVILMCFFPWFFRKADVPAWYTYATFIVLLISALAGYFFNYRQIVLTADQKEYKLNYAVQTVKSLKVVLQILAITFLSEGYTWWLLLELIAAILSVFAIEWIVKREYPWLIASPQKGKLLRMKYPQIRIKTKQLFFHKIAGFALTQTSPLIIYAYTSLTLVAVYGNYMLIVSGVSALLNAIFNSINAGVGSLVAEGNRTKMLQVFNELFSFRFLLSATICYGVYTLSTPFVRLWVGGEYMLGSLPVLLMVGIMYIGLMRTVVDSYINAFGLFQDVWAPVTEATLNVGLSVMFGYWWGLPGILGGVLVSLFLIVFLWKPWFMFVKGMHVSIFPYVGMYLRHILACILTFIIIHYSVKHLLVDTLVSYGQLFVCAFLCVGLFGLVLGGILYMMERGMKDFICRVSVLIKSKL